MRARLFFTRARTTTPPPTGHLVEKPLDGGVHAAERSHLHDQLKLRQLQHGGVGLEHVSSEVLLRRSVKRVHRPFGRDCTAPLDLRVNKKKNSGRARLPPTLNVMEMRACYVRTYAALFFFLYEATFPADGGGGYLTLELPFRFGDNPL